MNKIINGRRYNTKTAKFIGEVGYGLLGDLNFWEEKIYLKATGEYFMHCSGGANSKYAKPIGDNQTASDEFLKPLTLEEAQEWIETNLSSDVYENLFGKVTEGRIQISAWISESVKDALGELQERGFTIADAVEAGVKELQGK